MKKNIFLNPFGIILLFIAVGISSMSINSSENNIKKANYQLVADNSHLEWFGHYVKNEKIQKTHHGAITIYSGSMNITKESYSGNFTIDMHSIVDFDLKDSSKRHLLQNKLMSFKFFNADLFPEVDINVKKYNDKKAIVKIGVLDITLTDTVAMRLKVKKNQAILKGDFPIDFTDAKVIAMGVKPEQGGISPVVDFKLNAVLVHQ